MADTQQLRGIKGIAGLIEDDSHLYVSKWT